MTEDMRRAGHAGALGSHPYRLLDALHALAIPLDHEIGESAARGFLQRIVCANIQWDFGSPLIRLLPALLVEVDGLVLEIDLIPLEIEQSAHAGSRRDGQDYEE